MPSSRALLTIQIGIIVSVAALLFAIVFALCHLGDEATTSPVAAQPAKRLQLAVPIGRVEYTHGGYGIIYEWTDPKSGERFAVFGDCMVPMSPPDPAMATVEH